jgi:hypothetical protein
MTLTTTLKDQVRSDTKDALEVLFTYGAVGDDDTPPVAADTTLGNETFRDAIDEIDKASAIDKITASLRVLEGENNGNDMKELGILDAASSGNLWLRHIMNTITKTSDIAVFLDVTITVEVVEVTP